MDESVEIITDLSEQAFLQCIGESLTSLGWVLGDDDRTPNRGQLVRTGRDGSRSFMLRGPMRINQRTRLLEAMAGANPGCFASLDGDIFEEWRNGSKSIYLDGSQNGHFRDADWSSIAEGEVACDELPSQFVRALRKETYRTKTASMLATALHGEPLKSEGVVLQFYRPYDPQFCDQLRTLFSKVHVIVSETGTAKIHGFAAFRKRAEMGDIHIQAAKAFVIFIETGSEFEMSLDASLGAEAFTVEQQALLGTLRQACEVIRSGATDVLLTDGLVMGVQEFPGYEGRNPRTGAVVPVLPAKRPYFMGWTIF